MQTPVAIIWKDDNAERHFAKHGIPFQFAADVFLDDMRIEDPDLRKAHVPPRFNTIGLVRGRCINVTFAIEGGVATIISARQASRKERKRYAQNDPS